MLSQSVASELREAISAGEFQPGEQLSEVKAAERFNCSRNTLRESFTRLAAERIVERIPNRGVFLATPDADYIRDLFAARAAIEPAAVRWGAFADAPSLVTLTSSAFDYAARGEHQEVSATNQRFHRALVAALDSPTLNEQMDNLLARMRLTFLLAIPRYPQLHADHIQGNITLATLIADGKRLEAATLAHDSLMNTCEKILAVLDD
ncbi:GntR family transcriptional regulator [Corynebacterium tuberculostearicum]|uniref:GntR family transcriptional regulator n=1 Tax=Corynebacterium tuberculostearicum TaxID=38304 RepID=UPI00264A4192|nr:GntR family transcriptional regulator [Corynebacterium tuberculostearicum]WKE60011.1 GntR family transcriptional regulator [Corynebacterium tuberculostearicum]